MNLTVVRFLTAFFIFIILALILFLVSFVGGCMAAGALAGMNHPAEASEAGSEAGKHFAQSYTLILFIGSILVSGVLAVLASWSNLLPWCRENKGIADPSLHTDGVQPPL